MTWIDVAELSVSILLTLSLGLLLVCNYLEKRLFQ